MAVIFGEDTFGLVRQADSVVGATQNATWTSRVAADSGKRRWALINVTNNSWMAFGTAAPTNVESAVFIRNNQPWWYEIPRGRALYMRSRTGSIGIGIQVFETWPFLVQPDAFKTQNGIYGDRLYGVTRQYDSVVSDSNVFGPSTGAYAAILAANNSQRRWIRIRPEDNVVVHFGTSLPTNNNNSYIFRNSGDSQNLIMALEAGQVVYGRSETTTNRDGSIEVWNTFPYIVNTDPTA